MLIAVSLPDVRSRLKKPRTSARYARLCWRPITPMMVAEFAGEVRARVESRLGFRVGGKIIARKVDVGTMVKRGQVLMQLDPQDLQLAQAQANAALKAAESNRASGASRN